MADSKKYIGIYDTLEDVQDALDNGQLSNPYVAKTMDNGKIDYNSRSPIDYSQYWCTYYPIDAKIWVYTDNSGNITEYTGGDGKISKADFPNFYRAGSGGYYYDYSTVEKFKYFQFDSTSATTDFGITWAGCKNLASFPVIDTAKGTRFNATWKDCSALTSFPQLNVSKGTNFEEAWRGCRSLTEFPALDLSSGTNFMNAWRECSSLTSFPALDLSKGTDFTRTWGDCTSLTSFPALDLSRGTDFYNTWQNCSSLTSIGQLDLSAGTRFLGTWESCPALTTLGGFGAIKESFDLSASTLLTIDSLMNVIIQSADLNSLGIAGKTMTLGSTNLAKLTDEQKAVATSKGWTLA